jgi:hypothetical protein
MEGGACNEPQKSHKKKYIYEELISNYIYMFVGRWKESSFML